jgi:hypothetical protein
VSADPRARRRRTLHPDQRALPLPELTALAATDPSITSVFPDTVVQTCVVYVIRNAMRFVSYQDRKKIAMSMRRIYTAPTVEAAELALKDLDPEWGRRRAGTGNGPRATCPT